MKFLHVKPDMSFALSNKSIAFFRDGSPLQIPEEVEKKWANIIDEYEQCQEAMLQLYLAGLRKDKLEQAEKR